MRVKVVYITWPWSKEDIIAAVDRDPHTSVLERDIYILNMMEEETTEKVKHGFVEVVCLDGNMNKVGTK